MPWRTGLTVLRGLGKAERRGDRAGAAHLGDPVRIQVRRESDRFQRRQGWAALAGMLGEADAIDVNLSHWLFLRSAELEIEFSLNPNGGQNFGLVEEDAPWARPLCCLVHRPDYRWG